MADAEVDSVDHAEQRHETKTSRTELAAIALDSWTSTSRAVEHGTLSAWPDREALDLVHAIVASVIGADTAGVDAPARAWARTNTSLKVFATRLGTFRAGLGTAALFPDARSATRLAATLERVATTATEEWVAALRLAHAPLFEATRPVRTRPHRNGAASILTDRDRLQRAGVAILAGIAAGAAVMALVTSPAPHHQVLVGRPPPQPGPVLLQPPAGGRKHPAASLVAVRSPLTGHAASGRATRRTSFVGEGAPGAGSGDQTSGGSGNGVAGSVPGGGPGGVSVPPLPTLPPLPTTNPQPPVPAIPVSSASAR